ncbi:primosomal protein N' [Paraoerskovia marina]|uniref:primosomal protein N' family DNA-binding protein n=1 Tax=Paraoerskovia marina TaxID=545619 RepID=UPI0004922CB2|nr:primosomal protein N' [Paraoerskovia marina]
MTKDSAGEQDTLLDVPATPVRRRAARGAAAIAAAAPVARVTLDLAPAHLDRIFDYLVPESMDAAAQPGVRVKVRFGSQDVDGYVLARADTTSHDGTLQRIRRVVSDERVLTPEVAVLARAVADRWSGTMADVLRLAVPPRHARAELAGAAVDDPDPGAAPVRTPDPDVVSAHDRVARHWELYRGGAALLQRISAGGDPRAVWTALPGRTVAIPEVEDWAAGLAALARTAATAGRGVIVVLPDKRDVDHLARALDATGWSCCTARTPGDYVRLEADAGPSPRYRSFLSALHADVRVVIGTRAAAYAPVAGLGLVVCWEDGDDSLAEPRAPYAAARDVLALRSELEGAAFVVGSHGRTVSAQALLASGWAREVSAARDVVRSSAPRVRALTSTELASEGAGAAARLPTAAWRTARQALVDGPVLVQVPRAGYIPVVACSRCRASAQCPRCHGPLGLAGQRSTPQCSWCGHLAAGWRCDECGNDALRSVRVGSGRTAEELGRAFPGVPVRQSGASAPGGVLSRVEARPALVVATPGAEPVVDGGYAAALLLDAAVSTASVRLTAAERAVGRWMGAASLVRPASDGGVVLLVGDAAPAPTNALVRWDPAGLADRELAERVELSLPPAVRIASVSGDREAVSAVVSRVGLAREHADFVVLGPVEIERDERRTTDRTLARPVRTVLRVPVGEGGRLAKELAASLAVRSARREGGSVRVRLDPEEML